MSPLDAFRQICGVLAEVDERQRGWVLDALSGLKARDFTPAEQPPPEPAEPKAEERGGADEPRCGRCECLLMPNKPGTFCWSCWQRIGDGKLQAEHQAGCLRRFPVSCSCSCPERDTTGAGR